jgi:hypothetical protein
MVPEVPTIMPSELLSQENGRKVTSISVMNRDIAYSPTRGTKEVVVSPVSPYFQSTCQLLPEEGRE